MFIYGFIQERRGEEIQEESGIISIWLQIRQRIIKYVYLDDILDLLAFQSSHSYGSGGAIKSDIFHDQLNRLGNCLESSTKLGTCGPPMAEPKGFVGPVGKPNAPFKLGGGGKGGGGFVGIKVSP